MRKHLLVALATVAALAAGTAQATTLYSFEPDLEGFGPNGGGVTVTQDTIGATDGSNSMKVEVVAGATFVGALTGSVNPALGDPPGVDSLVFDMTIEDEFAGGFAVVGVTIFGASQPDYPGGQLFGLQAQFADFEQIGGKTAGTHQVRIDLDSATHPLTFATGSFNDIFGTFGSGPDDLIPTGLQLFLNKSNDAPLTVYFDNIRVPEPSTVGLLGVALVSLGALRRVRR